MQVSADLIVYQHLNKRSPQEIDAIFDDDSLADAIFASSGYALSCGWSDSARIFGSVGDACEILLENSLSPEMQQAIRAGFARLFLVAYMPDELRLRQLPETAYLASFSEQTARQIAAHLSGPPWSALCQQLLKSGFSQADAAAYLQQWQMLLHTATEAGLGILIHMG